MDNGSLFQFEDLLAKLESEHAAHFVYRGQNQEFVPLIPSLYRRFTDGSRSFPRGDFVSLHNRGDWFCQTYSELTFPEHFKRQFSFGKAVLGLFGLPLGTLFCQHCCVPSEALDVTDDFRIAAFFALYDYASERYIGDAHEPGVIYRIRVSPARFTDLQQIKQINDYSCPFYLDGTNVLGLLGECDTIAEAIDSYREFQFQDCYLKTQTDIDLSEYPLHRPLEVIRLPRAELEGGRVFRQKAGLVFPDLVFDERFDSRPGKQPGRGWKGSLCIEDLSKNERVEVFRFRQSETNSSLLAQSPHWILPEHDAIKTLLTNVFTGLFGVALLHLDSEMGVMLASGDEPDLVE